MRDLELENMSEEQGKLVDLQTKLERAETENDLMLSQIHLLEEELEHYFVRNRELEILEPNNVPNRSGSRIVWIDDVFLDFVTENQRLNALVDVLRKTQSFEKKSALNVRLGNTLVSGVKSPLSFLKIPFNIAKIWFESSWTKPPRRLGGKSYRIMIAAYQEGGLQGVEKLFKKLAIGPIIQANAYTFLARQLMENDRVNAALAARRAYECDPKSFRLKWLAFRLHETGDVVEAEAMLDILPTDTKFSESETRQTQQIKKEAKHCCHKNAKNVISYDEKRVEIEKEYDLLLLQLNQAQEELETQYQRNKKLHKKNTILLGEKKEFIKDKEKNTSKIESERILQQLHMVQEELEKQYLQKQDIDQKYKVLHRKSQDYEKYLIRTKSLDKQNILLNQELERSKKKLDERQFQNSELAKVKGLLEIEKSILKRKSDALEKKSIEHQAHIEELEREKITLHTKYEDLGTILHERQVLYDDLARTKESLESKTTELDTKYKELEEKLIEYEAHFEELIVLRKQLEKEKNTLNKRCSDLASSKEELQSENTKLNTKCLELENISDEHQRNNDDLVRSKEKLHRENTILNAKCEELEKISIERQAQFDDLVSVRVDLEKEKTVLSLKYEELEKKSGARQLKYDDLKAFKEQIEKEKAILHEKCIGLEKSLDSQLKEISSLQQQLLAKQSTDTDLASRQQMMNDEMARAEAQLDLIKDLLLK